MASAFAELGLGPALVAAVEAEGYEDPTPLQRAANAVNVAALIGAGALGVACLFARKRERSREMSRELASGR